MKNITTSIVALSSLFFTTHAFAPSTKSPFHRYSHIYAVASETAEMQEAIADVRAAASAFGDETEAFANKWIDNMLSGQGKNSALGILDECIIDFESDSGEKCDAFEAALKRLDSILGVGANEQF
ncbi:hypothetical protein CTEN210_16601 [Chaetoceros tenuissimus]|uniref:Pectinesterase inhibitor domain-containing protein n=1 Tax=Chaetoceros tenuissimus TaxID=426638 RepID=A0AAD3HDZ0_9STRA|nr:hypothetical protein CTEN210_16601 [Chaetoceros tenuissimus]